MSLYKDVRVEFETSLSFGNASHEMGEFGTVQEFRFDDLSPK